MITRIVPVRFENRSGITLFGTLYKPEINVEGNALILINPGVKGRVGPQRLYIKIAKIFAERGFGVLRLDASGLGDSEGSIEEETTRDFFLSVEQGRLVCDIEDAVDWLNKTYGYETYILGGLCGGAISALFAASTMRRVKAVLGLGMPVSMEGTGFSEVKNLFSWYLRFYRKGFFYGSFWYIKIFNRITYKMLLIMVKNEIFHFFKKRWNDFFVKDEKPKNYYRNRIKGSDINPFFLKAICNFSRNYKVLLIYGSNDRLYWEFEEKFIKVYEGEYKKIEKNLEVKKIENANHELTLCEWKNKMEKIIADWLNELGYYKRYDENRYMYC